MRTFTTSKKYQFFTGTSFGMWTNGNPAVPGVTGNVSFSCWFYLGKDGANTATSLDLVTYNFWRIHIRGNNNATQIRFDEAIAHVAADPVGLGAGDRNLHHVVATYEFTGGTNNTMEMYLDNILVATTNSTVLPTNNYSATGGFVGRINPENYVGKIMDLRIYHSLLAQSDVANIFNAGVLGTPAITPTLWFRLDEQMGLTMIDSSGNGNNGTYTAPGWPLRGSYGSFATRTLATNRTLT